MREACLARPSLRRRKPFPGGGGVRRAAVGVVGMVLMVGGAGLGAVQSGSAQVTLESIPVGGAPAGIAVGPAGTPAAGFVYVGNPGEMSGDSGTAGAVDVISTQPGAACVDASAVPCVVQVVPLPAALGAPTLPAGQSVAVSPGGDWLEVGGSSGSGLESFPIEADGLLGTGVVTDAPVAASIGGATQLAFAAAGPTAGDAWIATSQPEVSGEFATPIFAAPSGGYPSGELVADVPVAGAANTVAGGQQGVALSGDGKIAFLTLPDGGGQASLEEVGVAGSSTAPTFSASYVPVPFFASGSGLPFGAAVTPGGGHVWVTAQTTSASDGAVEVASTTASPAQLSESGAWTQVSSGGIFPTAVTVAPDGSQAVVLNEGNQPLGTSAGSIVVFSTGPTPSVLASYSASSLSSISSPQDVAVAPDSSVAYVTEAGDPFASPTIPGSVTVVPLPAQAVQALTITSSSPLPPATLGSSYGPVTLAASGGSGGDTWVLTGGQLPTGLALSSAGVISGTPAVAGSTTFAVSVTDSAGTTASASFTLVVGGCTDTISGTHSGPLSLTSGVTCIDGGTVTGPLTIGSGAVLAAVGAHLDGPVSADGGGALSVCGSLLGGSIAVSGATGPVVIGDAGDLGTPSCSGNAISGGVSLLGNLGGVFVGANTVIGTGNVSSNTSSEGGPFYVTGVAANSFGGYLACSDNSPGASDYGQPNTVAGPTSGQCATLGATVNALGSWRRGEDPGTR